MSFLGNQDSLIYQMRFRVLKKKIMIEAESIKMLFDYWRKCQSTVFNAVKFDELNF